MMEIWDEYIASVDSGEVQVCVYMRQCVSRFKELRLREDIDFQVWRVHKVISFMRMLRHFKGKTARQPFRLQPWQGFIVAYIFGLYKDGHRLVKNCYIEMARKNGKTAFVSALSLYVAFGDGEPGAEVDLAANSKEQAKISYEFCDTFAQQLDHRESRLRCYRDKVIDKLSKSKLQVFAADNTKLDGFDASMYLLDEYHASRTSKLRDVLQSSQGSRENPIGVVITTAGFDKLGPCYKYRQMCTEVLSGIVTDDSTAAFIYTIDDDDAWDDERCWIKSNPNIDVTVSREFIRSEVNRAKNFPSDEIAVRTKNINQWCDSSQVWIPDKYILASIEEVEPSQYKEIDWYGGVDLSSTTDLACFAMAGRDERTGKVYLWVEYFLPQESLNEPRFKDLYGEWQHSGAITLTPGNVTDYDIIMQHIKDMDSKCYIAKIAYDAWNATQFVINAEAAGLPMEPFSQTLGNFNRPTKEMERLLLSNKVVMDSNIINRHCFRNVALAVDRNGNTKPTKQFAEKKIDGVIAMLEALGLLITSPKWEYN